VSWKFCGNYRVSAQAELTHENSDLSPDELYARYCGGSIHFHYEARSSASEGISPPFLLPRQRGEQEEHPDRRCNLWSAARSAEPHLVSRKPARNRSSGRSAVTEKLTSSPAPGTPKKSTFPESLPALPPPLPPALRLLAEPREDGRPRAEGMHKPEKRRATSPRDVNCSLLPVQTEVREMAGRGQIRPDRHREELARSTVTLARRVPFLALVPPV